MQVTLKLSDRLIQDILNLDPKKSFNTAVNDLIAFALLKAKESKETVDLSSTIDLLDKPKANIYAEVMLEKILASDAFEENKEYVVSDFYHLVVGAPSYESLSMGDKQRLARSFQSEVKKHNASNPASPRFDVRGTAPKKYRIVKGTN